MKVKKRLSRIIAATLTVLMLFAALPAAAFAANVGDTVYSATFESGADGFERRGSATVARTDEQAHSGDYALVVSGRTAGWHGAIVPISGYLTDGGEYEASAWVRLPEGAEATVLKLTAQVDSASGTSYQQFGSKAVAAADGWVQLSGKLKFTGFSAVSMYLEADSATTDFYLDDVSLKYVGQDAIPLPTPDELAVAVNWNDDQGNDMDGVGGAFAFNKGHGLMQLAQTDPETVIDLIRLMFDPVEGAGLTVVRTIVGDGGVRAVGTAARPGYNPLNGLRADPENPGYDVEGNKIPMSTQIYTNANNAKNNVGVAADPNNYGFATDGKPLYGAYGYTLNDWGNRQYDGGSDTVWPNEEQGFVWDMPQWNAPISGDPGGMTNIQSDELGGIVSVDRPRTMKELFDLDQIWVMRQAMMYGVDTFYACAWTPPYWMKTSMSIFGNDPGSNLGFSGGSQDYLRAEVDENGVKIYYQAYADYLAGLVYGYWKEFGVPITHVGPFNESESSHGYSGFRMRDAADMNSLMNEYILPTFAEKFGAGGAYAGALSPDGKPLDWTPRVVIGDGTNMNASFGTGYTGPFLKDSENFGSVVASTHFYGSVTNNNNGKTFGSGLGVSPIIAGAGTVNSFPEALGNYTLWQTEYAMGDGTQHSGANGHRGAYQSMDDAIRWSYLMANSFNSQPGFNAFLFWWSIGNNGVSGSDLIRMQNTGSPQGNGSTIAGTYTVFKRLYTFAHYAKFIRTGDVHIGATTHLDSFLNTVAYRRPDGSDFSLTFTNADYVAKRVTVSLENFGGYTGGLGSVTAFRTTDSENVKKLAGIPVEGDSFVIELPAQSIVTVVPSDGAYAASQGLDGERDLYTTLEATASDAVVGAPEQATGAQGYPAMTLHAGDTLVYRNINFADGSVNGGLARKHLAYLMANVEDAPSGGILRAYVAEPGAAITDPASQATCVGEFLIPAGTSTPRQAGTTTAQLTGTRSTRLDTGDQGAYRHKDLYLVASGEAGAELFTISRFRFDADDNGDTTAIVPPGGNINQNVRPAAVGVLQNGDFETTGSAASTAGWAVSGTGTLSAVNEQVYSGLTSALNSTNAYSAKLSGREAGSGIAQDLTGKLTQGEVYAFRGMFMPTVSRATARAELVFLDAGGGQIGTETIAVRSGLNLLPAREGQSPARLDGTSAGSFGNLTIPYTGVPMNMTSVNPVSFRPGGWHAVAGSFTYAPPAGTATVLLTLGDDQTADLYIDQVTLVSAPNRDALLTVMNLALENETVAAAKVEARALYTGAGTTQAEIGALLAGLGIPNLSFSVTPDSEQVHYGDSFGVAVSFDEMVSTNAIAVTFTYDSAVLEFNGFEPADDLQVLKTQANAESGRVSVILAKFGGYEVTGVGTARFTARAEGAPIDSISSVGVRLELVGKLSADKVTYSAAASGAVELLPTIPDSFTLVDLSNIIDYFGVSSADARWADARQYDYVYDGVIDIQDIAFVAARVRLG